MTMYAVNLTLERNETSDNLEISSNMIYCDMLCMGDTSETLEKNGNLAFNIDVNSLQKLNINKSKHSNELIVTRNESTLQKFCDLCKRINLDPLHMYSLPIAVIFMSKSKHGKAIVNAYAKCVGCEDVVELLDTDGEDTQKQISLCEGVFNSMSDWLHLLPYLEIQASNSTAVLYAEHNQIVQRMIEALYEANLRPHASQKLNMLQLSLLALLYTSPRCTPAGKMLEKLHADISEHGPEGELKCLRAMSKFKDSSDDEEAYASMLVILMRCFDVKDGFKRSVEMILRQRKIAQEQARERQTALRISRPLLRLYAEKAVQQKQHVLSQQSWNEWRTAIQFPVAAGKYLQRLLYFISTQTVQADVKAYSHWYDPILLARAKEVQVDTIDVEALLAVIGSLRLYTSNVKHLIDFRAKCLHGLNTKARQELHLCQVLQLYIACFQHESVWEQCWKHILPIMNHTISSACKEFRQKYPYEVTEVVHNLGRCMLQE